MSTTYSIGAMNQLGDALENAGFSAEDVTKLKQFSNLKGLKDVLCGKAEIKYPEVKHPEHFIDCGANIFVPYGWGVYKHKKGGFLKFDPSKISLHLSEGQQNGSITGYDLEHELRGKPIMNVNVLEYLLKHCELIPGEWKDKHIFFWGTTYYDTYGYVHVRYLSYFGPRWGLDPGCPGWGWNSRRLARSLHSIDFAALLVDLKV